MTIRASQNQWLYYSGEPAEDRSGAIATFKNGDIAIAYSIAGAKTASTAIVERISKNGTIIWSKEINADYAPTVGSALTGDDDTLYIIGSTKSGASGESGKNDSDVYAVALSGSGQTLWYKNYGIGIHEIGATAVLDANGNILLHGRVSEVNDSYSFIKDVSNFYEAEFSSGWRGFQLQIDPVDGEVKKAYTTGSENSGGTTIAIDQKRNIAFIAGYTFGAVNGVYTIRGGDPSGANTYIIARNESTGAPLWTRMEHWLRSNIVVQESENAIYFVDNGDLEKVDASNGQTIWSKALPNTNYVLSQMPSGGILLKESESNGISTIRNFNASGKEVNSQAIIASDKIRFQSITEKEDGFIYIAGLTSGTFLSPTGTLSINQKQPGDDFFILKLKSAFSVAPQSIAPTSRRVADIRPGAASSYPFALTAVGETLFFRAEDAAAGYELWRSDGTAAGTVRVADIDPGPGSGYPANLTALGSQVLFTASNGSSGVELWRSDGTATGTRLIADLHRGSAGSDPKYLTVVGDRVFFRANDGSSGAELWQSDGTAAGTKLVTDLLPGSDGSYPAFLTAVGNRVFFRANDGSGGFELWQSDGTATSRVADITPGPDGSYPEQLVRVGDDLFFSARDAGSNVELWRFDGTAVQRVADINPGPEGSYPQSLTAIGSTLFFSATDGSSGYELWTSDGTAAGTVRVADIVPGSGSADIANLTPIGERLLFTASDDSGGNELWITDGESTSRVADIRPGAAGSYPDHLTVVNDVVYFQANNGSDGVELWRLLWQLDDSTVSRVADIRPGKPGSNPSQLKAVGDVLFFSADDGSSGEELWSVDGRPALAIAASSAIRAEGNSGSTPFSFTISRSGDTSAAASVDYSVTGSGSNRASASDFTANAFPAGTVNFAPGQTAAAIKIQVRGDLEVEANEGFAVSLRNAENATIGTAVAAGLIRNDDVPPPPPQLAIAASSAVLAEGNSGSTPFSFTISRSGDTSAAASVDYSVTGSGSGRSRASAGDFTANAFPAGTVSFAPEQTAATITIQVRGDRDVESNERFAVSLRNAVNATIGTSLASGLILNDDRRSRNSRARRDRQDGLNGLSGSSENLIRSKAAPAVTNPSALADTQLSHLRSGGWATDAGARAPFLLGATGAADLLQVITPLL